MKRKQNEGGPSDEPFVARSNAALNRRQLLKHACLPLIGAMPLSKVVGASDGYKMNERHYSSTRFVLKQEEVDYLVACVHGTVDSAVEESKRAEGVYAGHLQVLLEAAELWDEAVQMRPKWCPWPWPTREALGERLVEACRCLYDRGRHPVPRLYKETSTDGFRQEELAFFLRWYQEFNDRFWTPGHRAEWYPTSQALRAFVPSVPENKTRFISLAALDVLGFNHWDAAGILLPAEPPRLPWTRVEQFTAKQKEVDAWRDRRRHGRRRNM